MAETTVATDVHQALDVHRGFTAQITFDGELSDLVANFFQITVREVLDLLGVLDATGFANLASAGTTNAIDGGQANLSMLMRRNIDASDTCNMRPLILSKSTLALLMALIRADHAHHTLAADDLAVAADFLDRSRNSHFILLKLVHPFRPTSRNLTSLSDQGSRFTSSGPPCD